MPTVAEAVALTGKKRVSRKKKKKKPTFTPSVSVSQRTISVVEFQKTKTTKLVFEEGDSGRDEYMFPGTGYTHYCKYPCGERFHFKKDELVGLAKAILDSDPEALVKTTNGKFGPVSVIERVPTFSLTRGEFTLRKSGSRIRVSEEHQSNQLLIKPKHLIELCEKLIEGFDQ